MKYYSCLRFAAGILLYVCVLSDDNDGHIEKEVLDTEQCDDVLESSFLHNSIGINDITFNKKGYILCPLIFGQFGNQIDMLLGLMRVAHLLHRTLILPQLSHGKKYGKHNFFDFEDILQVDQILKYVPSVSCSQFRELLKSTKIEAIQITRLVHASHNEDVLLQQKPVDIPKDEKAFLKSLNWNFDFVKKMQHYTYGRNLANDFSDKWQTVFDPSQFPILFFSVPPVPYPTEWPNRLLQRYLRFSNNIIMGSENFIQKFIDRPYVGIHIRTWKSIHIRNQCPMKRWSGFQCRRTPDEITYDMCYQHEKLILLQTLEIVRNMAAKSVFVAMDRINTTLIENLSKFLKNSLDVDDFLVIYLPNELRTPQMDLAVLESADAFIGNCVSSYSAYVKRSRDEKGINYSYFWSTFQNQKSELQHMDQKYMQQVPHFFWKEEHIEKNVTEAWDFLLGNMNGKR